MKTLVLGLAAVVTVLAYRQRQMQEEMAVLDALVSDLFTGEIDAFLGGDSGPWCPR